MPTDEAAPSTEPAAGVRFDSLWTIDDVSPITSGDELTALLPGDGEVAAVFGDRTPLEGTTQMGEGPLRAPDMFLVEPEECADPAGDIAWTAARTWTSKEAVAEGPDALPQMTLSAEIRVFESDSAALEHFVTIAEKAEDCAYVLQAFNWNSSAFDPDSTQNDPNMDAFAEVDIDVLREMEPTFYNYDRPALTITPSAGIIQWLENAETKVDATSASTIVLVADRIVVTDVAQFAADSVVSDVYEDYLDFTRDVVERAAGRAAATSLPLVPFAEIPEISNASRPVAPGDEGAAPEISSDGVFYEVTGSASSASLTYATATGTSQMSVSLPWSQRISGMEPGDFLYVSAQNDDDSGSVTCSIYVDGERISNNTSSGAYVIASCDGNYGR